MVTFRRLSDDSDDSVSDCTSSRSVTIIGAATRCCVPASFDVSLITADSAVALAESVKFDESFDDIAPKLMGVCVHVLNYTS